LLKPIKTSGMILNTGQSTGKLFFALDTAMLTDTVDNKAKGITVFAPTNDALDKAAIADSALANVLKYHGE
jgi:uncharacterized surface protein with fasciclin (FAS1) repeats